MDSLTPAILARARAVKLLLMDCDGVLTDGRLYFSGDGEAMKVFHVRDGQGIADWHAAGFKSGIITGRDARPILEARASELGITYLYSSSRDKVADLRKIVDLSGVALEEIAYIGDDVGDLPVLDIVGFPVIVADACDRIAESAVYRTEKNGGCGAVREVADLLLSVKADSSKL